MSDFKFHIPATLPVQNIFEDIISYRQNIINPYFLADYYKIIVASDLSEFFKTIKLFFINFIHAVFIVTLKIHFLTVICFVCLICYTSY